MGKIRKLVTIGFLALALYLGFAALSVNAQESGLFTPLIKSQIDNEDVLPLSDVLLLDQWFPSALIDFLSGSYIPSLSVGSLFASNVTATQWINATFANTTSIDAQDVIISNNLTVGNHTQLGDNCFSDGSSLSCNLTNADKSLVLQMGPSRMKFFDSGVFAGEWYDHQLLLRSSGFSPLSITDVNGDNIFKVDTTPQVIIGSPAEEDWMVIQGSEIQGFELGTNQPFISSYEVDVETPIQVFKIDTSGTMEWAKFLVSGFDTSLRRGGPAYLVAGDSLVAHKWVNASYINASAFVRTDVVDFTGNITGNINRESSSQFPNSSAIAISHSFNSSTLFTGGGRVGSIDVYQRVNITENSFTLIDMSPLSVGLSIEGGSTVTAAGLANLTAVYDGPFGVGSGLDAGWVKILVANDNTDGSENNVGLFSRVSGNSTGDYFGASTVAINNGNGNAYGYRGAVVKTAGSGNAVGLEAYVQGNAGLTAMYGVRSLPVSFGSEPSLARRFGYWGRNHALVGAGSLWVLNDLQSTLAINPARYVGNASVGNGYFDGSVEINQSLYVGNASVFEGQINATAGVNVTGVAHVDDLLYIQPRSAQPAGYLGLLYVDSDTGTLCFHDGSGWVGLNSVLGVCP